MIDERTPEELEAAREALGMNAEELEQARNYVAGDSKWIAAGGRPSVTAHSPGPGERRDPRPHLALRGRCPGHDDAAGYQLVDGLHRGLSRVRAIILAWGPFKVNQHVRACLDARQVARLGSAIITHQGTVSDRRTALDLVNAVTATLISRFEGGALGTTIRPGISSSTDCTAGGRVSAPSSDRRDRRTALDLVNAVTATLNSRFEEGALGTTMRLGISSSTDCTAGCRVSAPSSWPGVLFEVDQHVRSTRRYAKLSDRSVVRLLRKRNRSADDGLSLGCPSQGSRLRKPSKRKGSLAERGGYSTAPGPGLEPREFAGL